MKQLHRLALIPLILTLAAVPTAAAGLSPGLEVIASEHPMVKTGVAGSAICFKAQDFADALGLSSVSGITVTSLPDPSLGRLRLGSLDVANGQTVSAKNLSSLKFIPSSGELQASFGFRVGSGEGVDYECRVFALSRVNRAPVAAQPKAVETGIFSGLEYFGTVKAADPDGDGLRFELISRPTHGSVSLSSPELGYYVYTPDAEFNGRDSFTVCAVDEYGARSNNVRVTLHVDEAKEGELPSQLDGHWASAALLTCQRAGLLDCAKLDPDAPMSRAEFLTFMMNAAGYRGFSTDNTGFSDDELIPAEYKGSIAAAEVLGVISGIRTDDGLCFYPNNQITRAEAAVIVARLTGAVYTFGDNISVETSLGVGEDDEMPVWARSSIAALGAEGILRGSIKDGVVTLSPFDVITVGSAAQLASAVLELK